MLFAITTAISLSPPPQPELAIQSVLSPLAQETSNLDQADGRATVRDLDVRHVVMSRLGGSDRVELEIASQLPENGMVPGVPRAMNSPATEAGHLLAQLLPLLLLNIRRSQRAALPHMGTVQCVGTVDLTSLSLLHNKIPTTRSPIRRRLKLQMTFLSPTPQHLGSNSSDCLLTIFPNHRTAYALISSRLG